MITNKYLQYVIIAGLCLACYVDHLDGDFVFDDRVAVVKNRMVTGPKKTWSDLFSHDFWGMNMSSATSHKSFRPLTVLTFRTEHNIYGLNPFRMKMINLVLHIIISGLVLCLGDLVFRDHRHTSFIAAILFAVHPIHTEAVSGIVGRADLLATVLFIFAVILYVISFTDNRHSIGRPLKILTFGAIIGLTIIAILCKETGFVILPMCVAVELLYNSNVVDKLLKLRPVKLILYKETVLRFLWLATTGAIIVLYRLYKYGRPTFKVEDNPVAASDDLLLRAINQTFLYCLNSWLLICPDWLSFDWAIGSITLIKGLTSDIRILSILSFFMYMFVLLTKSSRKQLFAAALCVIPFLPASGIIPVGFVIAERILYMPSIGFCLLVARGYRKIGEHFDQKWAKAFLRVLFWFTVLTFVAKSRHRANEWLTEEKLFNAGLRVCPNNAKIHYNIAKVAADRNDIEKAFQFYHSAIRLYPRYETAIMNLGNLYRAQGELITAEKYFLEAIEILDAFPAAWMNLGIVQASMGRYEESLVSYKTALKHRSYYPTCYYNLGNAYVAMNDPAMAYTSWREAVALDPTLLKAWSNLLALLNNQNRLQEVLAMSDLAARSLPNEPDLLFTRASVLGKLNQFEESEALFKQIIQQNPQQANYYSNLGVLYHRWKRYRRARENYAKALTIDPNLSSVRNHLRQINRLIQ